MSRRNNVSEKQQAYIQAIRANLPVIKAETEVLEMRERNLRASINVYKLQLEWEEIEERLEKEQALADSLKEGEDEAENTDNA